ncbi:MAG: serine protease, partial [Desulfurococcales archaeon]|nr:serine protease [Desulfurococcales archaeon]
MRRISAGILATLILVILLSNALAPVAGAQRRQEFVGECTLRIAAVSSSGGGVLGNLTVRVTEGTGRVYISTSPATEVDTQGAALIAAFTASMLLGVDPARYDFYYTLESPSIIVGG